MKTLSGSLRKLFWFTDAGKIDVQKDANLVVHQVLSLGDLKDIRRLFVLYPKSTIKKEFLKAKKGMYHPAVLKLCADLLGVKIKNPRRYIKNVYGN